MKTVKLVLFMAVSIFVLGALAQRDDRFSYPSNPVSDWCENRVMTLQHARSEATAAYQAGDYTSAITTLERGFLRASSDVRGYYTGALTGKAIVRGTQIANAVKRAVHQKQLYAKTMIHFMVSYINFIERVATELDTPYFTPSSCYYCRGEGITDFEEKFVEFARAQVSVIQDSLITNSTGRIYPLGEPAAYLKSLELSLSYLVTDLRNSLFARSYACVIQEAQYLSHKLAEYNQFGTGFPNDVYAVNNGYQGAEDILGYHTCNSGRYDRRF